MRAAARRLLAAATGIPTADANAVRELREALVNAGDLAA